MAVLSAERGWIFLTGFGCGWLAAFLWGKLKRVQTSCKASKGSNNAIECDTLNENPTDCKLVLVVRNDLKMGKGKIAAQCSHAAVMAHERAKKNQPSLLSTWKGQGQPKIVLKIDTQKEMLELADQARHAGLAVSIVTDAGRTQIKSGSKTVMAVGPADTSVINSVTGHLKLL